MKTTYYYGFIISFLLGTATSNLLAINFWVLIFLTFLSFLIISFLENKLIIIFLIISFGFLLGFLRTELFITHYQSSLNHLIDKNITLIGDIADEPDIRENYVIYKIKLENSYEIVQIFVPHFPRYQYGNKISVKGKLEAPKNFKNENDIEFDYISFLARANIFYMMYRPQVEVIDDGNFSIKRFLFSIKQKFIDGLNKTLVPPQSSLAAGLIVGAKQALGKDLLDKFRKVGLIHIVVLSGYNIAIVAEIIKKIFQFLSRRGSFLAGSISIFLFTILTGANATIIRASIMVFLVMLAKYLYRPYAINRSLFLAAFLMVFINPRILLDDPGFQLSFVATLGLVHLTPFISKIFLFFPEKFGIREIVSSTLATQIAVLPLLVNMTGEISTVALLVNIIVLPLIPLTMLLGFIAGVISIFSVTLSLPFGFLVNLLLSYQMEIVKWFSNLSFVVWKI